MAEQKKIMMEVTRGEAEAILYERLENKWYVDFQPLFVLLPGVIIAFFIYGWLSNHIAEWQAILAVCPIIVFCFYMLIRFINRRREKASELYETMVKPNKVQALRGLSKGVRERWN